MSSKITRIYVDTTEITNVPTELTAGTPLILTGTVQPSNASNQTIIWTLFDVGTTDATITDGNILNADSAGTITVRATITDGLATGTDYEQDFTITTIVVGVAETPCNESIMLYPNPVKDELTITNYGLGIENVVITDLSGRIVVVVGAGSVGAGLKPALTGETTTINVSTLPNGVYFLKIANNVKKFIKN